MQHGLLNLNQSGSRSVGERATFRYFNFNIHFRESSLEKMADAKKVKGKGATNHHETTNGLLIHEKCRHDVEGFLA